MDNRAVGIFDTGFGGLTGLAAFRELMPEEDIIYFGDTKRCPYGGRTPDEIRSMTGDILSFFDGFDIKVLLAACGTISVNCRDIFAEHHIPVLNVLDPTLEKMRKTDGKVCVIATQASINSGAFMIPGMDIVPVACPDFVTLIESGHMSKEDPKVAAAVEKYLGGHMDISAIVLGCTHFGIISEAISSFLGDGVEIIEASRCAAENLRDYVLGNGISGGEGNTAFYTSGDTVLFDETAERILNATRCGYKPALSARI